jgi:hypothetical protein
MSINLFPQPIKRPQIEFNPRIYNAGKVKGDISIDGRIDEKDWLSIDWSEYFVDIEGERKPVPYYKTKMKMLWSGECLYIAAEMEEPHLNASLQKRDTVIFYDNDFEVFIDPDGDTHNYYELEVNQLNTQWDLFLLKPYRDIKNAALNGYDIKGLKTAVHLNGTLNNPGDIDSGWTIEIAIPWKAIFEKDGMKYPPNKGDYIRVNFSRVQWEYDIIDGKYIKKKNPHSGKVLSGHNWVWSPQGIVNMHYPEMWGFVVLNSGENEFEIPEIEKKKWLLREIYYAEWDYYYKNSAFIFTLDKLQKFFDKKLNNIIIESCGNYFNVFYERDDGRRILSIKEDGLIKVYK